ncbi:MAG: radical SAM protein [Pseudomonadota bacterium]
MMSLPRKSARLIVSAVSRNEALYELDARRRSARLMCTPVNLYVEITNRCNLSCRTCGRNYWDKSLNPLGDMSPDTMLKLDPYLKRASWINVWGYGESLLSPRFFDLMDKCARFEGRIQLFSNGTTLTEENSLRLIEKNLHSLVISLDGASARTIQDARSGVLLEDVVDKITRLNRLKRSRGVGHPRLSFSFTASMKNIHELPDLIRLAARLDAGTVSAHMARIFDPSLKQDSVLNDIPSAMSAFAEAKQVGRDLGVEVFVQDPAHQGCHQPFELIFVKWNGDVFGCCASAFHSLPPLQIFLGNVHETTLPAMWNGEYMGTMRKGLLGQAPLNEICARCPYYRLTFENLQKYPVQRAG